MEQTRIAVYDLDAAYTERFCQCMEERFGRDMVFTPVYERQDLDRILAERSALAVLVPDDLREEYPPFVGDIHVGYLTGAKSGEAGEIFRFQSLRNLRASIEKLMKKQDTSVKVIAFVGAGASVGTSAAAAAFAQRMASEDCRVLYLNMNALGDRTGIFQGGNPKGLQFVLEEIEKGSNLDGPMAAALNRDVNGVYFYDNAEAPLGLMDITREQMTGFLQKLKENGGFRYLVIDSSFCVNRGLFAVLSFADKIIGVHDGAYPSNLEFSRMWTLLKKLEVSGYPGICEKVGILYNKFHKQYGRRYEDTEIPVVGTIEVLPPAGPVQIVSQIAGMTVLQEILR